MSLSPERLAAIRERLAAATPGPWEATETDDGHEIRMGTALQSRGRYDTHHLLRYDHGCYLDEDTGAAEPERRQAREAAANAALIANAPQDLADLLAERDALEAQVARLHAALTACVVQFDHESANRFGHARIRTDMERLVVAAQTRDALAAGWPNTPALEEVLADMEREAKP